LHGLQQTGVSLATCFITNKNRLKSTKYPTNHLLQPREIQAKLAKAKNAGNFLFIPMLDYEMGKQSDAVSYTQQVINACKKYGLSKKESLFAILWQSINHGKV
jgi:hypothetical protein